MLFTESLSESLSPSLPQTLASTMTSLASDLTIPGYLITLHRVLLSCRLDFNAPEMLV